CERVHALARSNRRSLGLGAAAAPVASATPASAARKPLAPRDAATAPAPAPAEPVRRSAAAGKRSYKLVAIGTSTGGPVALQKILTRLPASFPAPILLIQHMPGTFTTAFADRLDKLCQITVREAVDGDMLRPGVALLAPGGKQMMIDARGTVRILPGDERLNYKPSVDVTFRSVVSGLEARVLAIVLTGMGADGREGARMFKQYGSAVWAQDEASCVIYAMPKAVVKVNLAVSVYDMDEISRYLTELG